MHIVHVVTRLLRAGSEENTLATCRWQIRAGHQVTLIHGRGYDPYWDTHLPKGLHRIAVPEMLHPVRPLADLRAVRRLRAIYNDLAPDVIHTHQSKAGILGRLAASAVPAALVVHGIHIVPFEGVGRAKRAVYIAMERHVAARTDVFMSVSEAVGQSYVAAGIARPQQVHCVRSGMDVPRFANAVPPADARQMLGLTADAPMPQIVVMMAAFEPRKQHVPFLQAFAKVVDQLPEVKIMLAGTGPLEQHVRAAVQDLGLQQQVVFCGHRPDPEALFALADLSVMTSANEGLPRVVIQSIAAGCPPLVQDLPGLEEVLDHRQNGWITPPSDMDRTIAQMRAILQDKALLAQLKQGARQTDLGAWALDRLGARTTALYDFSRGKADRRHPVRMELA